MSKETYQCQKRPISVKRDLSVSKETYQCQKRPSRSCLQTVSLANDPSGMMCGSHKSPTEPHHLARASLSPPQWFIEDVGLGPVSDL
jgi:hypothetical protein